MIKKFKWILLWSFLVFLLVWCQVSISDSTSNRTNGDQNYQKRKLSDEVISTIRSRDSESEVILIQNWLFLGTKSWHSSDRRNSDFEYSNWNTIEYTDFFRLNLLDQESGSWLGGKSVSLNTENACYSTYRAWKHSIYCWINGHLCSLGEVLISDQWTYLCKSKYDIIPLSKESTNLYNSVIKDKYSLRYFWELTLEELNENDIKLTWSTLNYEVIDQTENKDYSKTWELFANLSEWSEILSTIDKFDISTESYLKEELHDWLITYTPSQLVLKMNKEFKDDLNLIPEFEVRCSTYDWSNINSDQLYLCLSQFWKTRFYNLDNFDFIFN